MTRSGDLRSEGPLGYPARGMFKKILVANRGEIACRIIRTARRLGIQTVAVYSAADDGALHVTMADEAVSIGPAPASDSYLSIERIIAAARETGADALHPGYGFLAENAPFAEAVAAAGLAFIGPPPTAIAAMGDKLEARHLAAMAGVPTIPGGGNAVADENEAARLARSIGYPVMLKAAAGGGGKGMRVARNRAELRTGLRSAANEAQAAFADDRVFIEKYVEQPRHIEIQILADGHGNVVHLGERECSIQRRHQKVIEEAPSPLIDASMRAAMGAQAVALARSVDYVSAGTVEFLADAGRNFYFLEMNTRLQVEHPVTEMVTGLDLVELMIRIAAGEALPFGQNEVRLDGWAVEARVYAEDPTRDFLPSTGRITSYAEPAAGHGLRVESGVAEGTEVGMHYDPILAKVIAHGPDRAAAVARLRGALDAYYIRGIRHNLGFLAAVMARPRFAKGRLGTDFIAAEYPRGFTPPAPDRQQGTRFAAVAAVIHRRTVERALTADGHFNGEPPAPGADWVVRLAGEERRVRLVPRDGGYAVRVGRRRTLTVLGDWRPGLPLFRARIDGQEACIQVDLVGAGYRLSHGGVETTALVLTPRVAELAALMPAKRAPDMSKFLLSPMPGLLVSVAVSRGQKIKAGEELAVVEAMKMENVLRAGRDGVVAGIRAEAGASLAVDQVILEFD